MRSTQEGPVRVRRNMSLNILGVKMLLERQPPGHPHPLWTNYLESTYMVLTTLPPIFPLRWEAFKKKKKKKRKTHFMIIKMIVHVHCARPEAKHFPHTVSLNKNNKGVWHMPKKKRDFISQERHPTRLQMGTQIKGPLTPATSCSKSLVNKVH